MAELEHINTLMHQLALSTQSTYKPYYPITAPVQSSELQNNRQPLDGSVVGSTNALATQNSTYNENPLYKTATTSGLNASTGTNTGTHNSRRSSAFQPANASPNVPISIPQTWVNNIENFEPNEERAMTPGAIKSLHGTDPYFTKAVNAAKEELKRLKDEKQKDEALRTMKRAELNNKMEETMKEEKTAQEKRKVLVNARPSFLAHVGSQLGSIVHIEDISNTAAQSIAFLVFTSSGAIEYWDTLPVGQQPTATSPGRRASAAPSTANRSRAQSSISQHMPQPETRKLTNNLTLHDFYETISDFIPPITAVVKVRYSTGDGADNMSMTGAESSGSLRVSRRPSVAFALGGRKSSVDMHTSKMGSRQASASGLSLNRKPEVVEHSYVFFIGTQTGVGGFLHWDILDSGSAKKHRLKWDIIEFLPSPSQPLAIEKVCYASTAKCIIVSHPGLIIAYSDSTLKEKSRSVWEMGFKPELCACPHEPRLFISQSDPPSLHTWLLGKSMVSTRNLNKKDMTMIEEEEEAEDEVTDQETISHHSREEVQGDTFANTPILSSHNFSQEAPGDQNLRVVLMQLMRSMVRSMLMIGLNNNRLLFWKDNEVRNRIDLPPVEEIGTLSAAVFEDSIGVCITDRGELCTFSISPLSTIPTLQKSNTFCTALPS